MAVYAARLALVALVVAWHPAAPASDSVRFDAGVARLVSPGFGYTVRYRTVTHGYSVQTAIALFAFTRGHRTEITPPQLRHDGIDVIDDVAFLDRRRGWVVGFNCADAAVFVYRTVDGGRTWRSLGRPSGHSCGGGPSYLSFVDDTHGWLEPISPNGPGGVLLRTRDGGRSWKTVELPCLAPIRFVSASVGWMARCAGDVFETRNGGARWVRMLHRHGLAYDLPSFEGSRGVLPATRIVGARSGADMTGGVVFATTADGGRHWRTAARRRIGECSVDPYYTSIWPAAVAGPRTWWIVGGRRRVVVQRTSDAGRHWVSVQAHGLPARRCAISAVTASDATHAWAIGRGGRSRGLFATSDGGRTWRRILGAEG